MMPSLLLPHLLTALALAGTVGILYAEHDALAIYWQDHQMQPVPLKHTGRALGRLVGAFALATLLPTPTWLALGLTVAALYFAFALPFQVAINLDRGRSWDYVGKNDLYDRVLTRLFGEEAGEMGVALCGLGLLAAVGGRLLLG